MRAALVVASLLAFSSAQDVVKGDASNIDELVKNGIVLVQFHAPWCGQCKRLAPEWEKAAGALKGTATLVEVDATVERQVASKFGVSNPTVPTIKVFFDGDEPVDYDGEFKKSDQIVDWVKKRSGPLMHEFSTASELAELKGKHAMVLAGFFAGADSEGAAEFKKFAKEKRGHFTFAVAYGEPTATQCDAAVPSAVLYKTFDHGKDVLDVAVTRDTLSIFLKAHSFPILAEIGMDNYQGYADRGLPMAYLFLDPAHKEATEKALAAVKEVAAEHTGKISFVWVNAPKMPHVAGNVGLKKKRWPAFAFDHAGLHFAFDESAEVTKEAIAKFADDYLANKLEPTIKSEDEPTTLTENGLTTLVGTNFKKVVFDDTKDVFIKFYAPYCGHCKNMIPAYQEVADTFKDNDGVLIANMDAVANDVPPEFPISGFPQMYFVKAGTNEILKYPGQREAEKMITFIRNHGTNVPKDEEL